MGHFGNFGFHVVETLHFSWSKEIGAFWDFSHDFRSGESQYPKMAHLKREKRNGPFWSIGYSYRLLCTAYILNLICKYPLFLTLTQV